MAIKTSKTAAPARARRTKAEVQQAFRDIEQETNEARKTADSKSEEVAQLREQEVKAAFQDFTVESVVDRISELSVQITRSLSGVSEQLSGEVSRLTMAREAVEIERREIERLHKKDVALTAIDQLVQEYAQKKQQLEADMEAQRADWETEENAREKERKEYEENLKKARQREVEDYEYKKALERKKAQDKYDEEQRLVERRNQERQEQLEKSWQVRETALKEREQELERLRKESQEFPSRLQAEVDKAVKEALKAADAKHAQDQIILKKDGEAEKRVAELRIKALEETVAIQRAQMEALDRRVEDAKTQVQEIAVKAIEGASGARALAHVNQIAIEQAKQRNPQG
ncbi:MAG: hypothetical protein HY235_06825 [Acidobacteria bacterium]|nr:hypothetical protein [Acidobacteriota bacterium]